MNGQMKTPGKILKAAREEMGKSQSDMAKLTRISIQQLQGLEDDNYNKIPAPMYVRGFIKLYAQKLGLQYEPLIEMYERMRAGESPVPEEKKPMPQPAVEAAPPEAAVPEHPEISRDVSRPPLRSLPRFDWRAWLGKLPEIPLTVDAEWVRKPSVRYGAMGFGVFILLLLTVKSCGSPASETEPVDEPEILQVEEPLLSPPEPVYFQLPSSYQ